MTILIADDIAMNRKLVRAALRAEGYELVEATNGQEALAFLEAATGPVVGVIDWEMPEMDGMEVCRQARRREDGPPLFLIVLTIRDDTDDIVKGLQEGANDYVTKPFDYAELQARVRLGVQMVELQQTLVERVRELGETLERVKLLSRCFPICGYCRQIREEDDQWEPIDTYMARHSTAEFNQVICPECAAEHGVAATTLAEPGA